MLTFGEKIKQARKSKNLTQSELASAIGVSRRVIISWENDESKPRTDERLTELARVLDVDVDYLLISTLNIQMMTLVNKKLALKECIRMLNAEINKIDDELKLLRD